MSHSSRYEPREASGAVTATLISFSLAAIVSISGALQDGILENFRPLVGFVERADGISLDDLHVPERRGLLHVGRNVVHADQVLLAFPQHVLVEEQRRVRMRRAPRDADGENFRGYRPEAHRKLIRLR